MIPLEIKAETRSPESSSTGVGIYTCSDGCWLQLPHGYQKGNTASENRTIAVEIYRMLFRFAEICRHNDSSLVRPKKPDVEGSLRASDGLAYQRPAGAVFPNFSFRLISALRELFSLLRTPTILSLKPQNAPSYGHFDWRQIEKQLHRAMYLPDGTPMFNAMDAPRPILRDQTADIVGMACWVARDACAQFLNQDLQSIAGSGLAREWGALADDFSERYLGRFQSLFADPTGKTCQELLHVLLEIDRRTPFKSPCYLDIFDLLEPILSYHVCGDGGDVWAMEGFAYAWESICLDYAIGMFGKQSEQEIFTCDVKYLDRTIIDQETLQYWNMNRIEVFSRNARDRRPDLIIKNAEQGTWRVIDFKYYSENELPKTKQRPFHQDYEFYKVAQDLDNLEAYGLLLTTSKHNVDLEKITYEIWAPGAKVGAKTWALESHDKSHWNIRVVHMETPKLVKAYCKKFRMWE
jgi:hypothetical protein